MAQCDAVRLPEKNRGEKGGRGKVEEDVKGTKKILFILNLNGSS